MSATPNSEPGRVTSLRLPSRTSAIKIAAGYAVAGVIWILGTDWVLHRMVESRVFHENLSLAKGWVFVLATALMLGVALDRYFALLRRSAELLRESEDRWKQALEGTSQAVWDWDVRGGNVLYAPEWKSMLGYADAEVGSTLKDWETRVHPEDLERAQLEVRRHLEGQSAAYACEYRMRCKDGSYKWILGQGRVTDRAPDGKALRMVGTHADISRRKRAEEALAASEARFRTLFDYSPDGVLVVSSEDRRVLSANESMCRMLGYTAEELLELEVADLHPQESLIEVAQEFEQLRRNRKHFSTDIPVRRKDGSVFPADISASSFEMGGVACMVGLFRDITARVEAEERSRIKHDLMQALASTTSLEEGLNQCLDSALEAAGMDCGGFYLLDESSGQLRLCLHRGLGNEFVRAVAQYGPDTAQVKAVGLGQPEYFDSEALRREGVSLFDEEGLSSVAIVPVCHESRAIGSLNVASHTQSSIPAAACMALETIAAGAAQAIARLHAEEELRESERNFRSFFQTVDDVIVVATDEGRILFGNDALERKLGFTPVELAGMTVEQLHPAELRVEARGILAAMLRGERKSCPLPLARKDGGRLPVETRAWAGRWNGRRCLFGVCKDLTAEQEAQQRFEQLFRHNPIPIALSDLTDQRFTDVNDAWLADLGFERNEVVGKTPLELDLFRDPDAYRVAAARLLEAGAIREVELRVRTKSGAIRDGLFTGEILRAQGRGQLLTVMVDITERKRMETVLRESERQLGNLMGNLPGMVYRCRNTPDWPMVFVSEGCSNLTGYSAARLVDNKPAYADIILEEDRQGVWDGVQRALAESQSFELTYRIRTAAGAIRWAWERGRGILGDDGQLMFLEGFIADITERKRSEEALRASETKYRIVADKTFDWEFWLGPDGRFKYSSPSCERISGYGAEAFAADAELMRRIVHPEDEASFAAHECAVLGGCSAAELEFRIVRLDGQVRWIGHACGPIWGEDGVFLGVRGSNRDITDRKRAESELLSTHQERERLLRFSEALLSAIPTPVFYKDRDGRYLGCNRRFTEFIGMTSEDLRGKTVFDLWPEAFARQFHDKDLELMANPAEQTFDLTLPDRHGVERSVIFVKNLFLDENSQPAGIIGAFLDITERKRAEEALGAEVTRRRILIEGSRDGIVVLDQQGKVFEANRRFAESLGYSETEVLGLHVWDWDRDFPPERVLEAIRALGPEGAMFETRHLRKDGSWFSVELSNSAAELGGQKLVFCVCRDLTDRKRAEVQAARDVLRTKFLLELHQQAPHMTDAELYDHVLDRAVRLTGSAIGFFHQVSEDQNTILLTTWNQEALKHCTAAFEAHYPLREAGNWVDCVRERRPVVYNDYASSPHQRGLPPGHTPVRRFMSIPVLQGGKVRTIFGVGNKETDYDEADVEQLQVVANELHKIMSQRAAENQLRQLSRAVEQSPVSVVITNTSGSIEYVNPRFSEVSGYTLDEVRGRNPRVLKSGEMAPEEYQRLWQTILAGQPWHGEFHNRKKNGELHWESASISPITGSNGKITHFVAVKEDISERKRLESQLRQAQKLEAVGQLAGGVAHDFNNILAVIMMHLGLLQTNPALDTEMQQSLKELQTEAKRAATLTRQLLMFSRRSVLAIKPQDMNEVVANLLKMLTRLIGENITLCFEGGSQLPAVEADAGMLEQVLMNLVVNARDAMPAGGRITISTSAVQLTADAAGSHPDRRPGRFVCVAVADTGTGMSEAVLRRVFEPFFTTKEAGKGTGLGLATVHGIAAQHKGWVEVESALGAGTTFRVFFPALAGATVGPAETTEPALLRSGRETILVVEDEPRVRQVLCRTLRTLGYQVHEAANGQAAMAVWQQLGGQVDLLFTDMVMPEGMTGLELTERLQTSKPGLKAIISSGYSAEIVHTGAPTKSGIAYLPKPYSDKTLVDTVRQCLDQGR